MKRKTICCMLLCLCTMSLFFIACGKKDKKEEAEEYRVELSQIEQAVLEDLGNLPDMERVDKNTTDAQNLFAILCDISYDKIDEFVYQYASEGLADEIAIIRLKDTQDMKELKEELEERIESRKTSFQTYNPEEVEKLEQAQVVVKGNYVALLICQQSGVAKQAFLACFPDK